MESEELRQRLEFAVQATREASERILAYYQQPQLVVERKRDLTPVTGADRSAEELLRQRISNEYPDDGILGEEFSEKAGRNDCRWFLDPIDGTKAFIHGVPLFGTLVGLECGEEMVLGVCRFPALNEVVYAARGQGAWWQIGDAQPSQAHVSEVSAIVDATVVYTEIEGWQETGRIRKLLSLAETAELTRGWGDCYGHMLVATGRADVMLDPILNDWDAAALVPIVEEAGGHFLDWHGHPSFRSGNGFSVNAALKTDVIALLNG